MLSFFPLDVLDEIWDLIGSVSEDFPTYYFIHLYQIRKMLSAVVELRIDHKLRCTENRAERLLPEQINGIPFQRKEGVVGGGLAEDGSNMIYILHQQRTTLPFMYTRMLRMSSPYSINNVQVIRMLNFLTDYYFNL